VVELLILPFAATLSSRTNPWWRAHGWARGEDRRRGRGERRHRRIADPRDQCGRGRQLRKRLDPRDRRYGESLHRHLHRHLAFILAYIWTNHIEVRPAGDKAKIGEIWERFPKFIIGYVLTLLIALLLAYGAAPGTATKVRAAMVEANTFRVIFSS